MAHIIKLYDYSLDGCDYCIGCGNMTLQELSWQLEYANGEDVEIHISSMGGSAFEAIGMYDAIKKYVGKKTTYIDALAASAASIVAMAGDECVMSKYALLMIHKPAVGSGGDADQLIADAAMLNVVQSRLAGIYVDKTGLDEATVNELINATTWMTAEQALSLGFVDTVEDYASEVTNFEKLKVYAQAAPAVYQRVFNKLQIKQPVTNSVTMNTDKELIKKTETVLTKVMNWFKSVTNSVKDGDKVLNYTGALAKGTKVFNDAGEDMDDGVYNIEKDGVKSKLTVANSVVNEMETESEDAGENGEDAEEVNNKAVLNAAGITGVTNKVDVKNFATVINKFNGDIRERDAIIAEQQAALTEVRNQVARDEQAIRKDIKSTFTPNNGNRTNKLTDSEAKDENGVKNVLNKSIAPTSPIAKAALERMGIKIKTDEQ